MAVERVLQEDGSSFILQESSVVESVVNGPFGGQNKDYYKKTFTAATTDILTSTGHGLVTDDRIKFESSGTLPAGLNTTTVYFVKQIDADTFTVALTSGGADVDITDTGSGTHKFITIGSWSQTISNTSNRLLTVWIGYIPTGASVSSVTFGGTTLTFKARIVQDSVDPGSGGSGGVVELWYLVAPTNDTTDTVLVTMSGLPDAPSFVPVVGSSAAHHNVHQTTPFGTVFTSETAGTQTITVNVTGTDSRSSVFDYIAYNATSTPTAAFGAGQTERLNGAAGSGGVDVRSYGSEEPGNGTITMSWSTSPTNVNGVQMAVEIRAPTTVADKILLESSTQAYTLTANVTTFAHTGNTAGLRAARQLPTSVGAFSLTGVAAGLRAARKLAAATGTYTLTGVAAALRSARKLAAATGSFALTGITTGLRAARRLTATLGTFAVTANAATLLLGKRITVSVGAFALTGVAVALRAARKLQASVRTYALTGNNATLTYTPVSPPESTSAYQLMFGA